MVEYIAQARKWLNAHEVTISEETNVLHAALSTRYHEHCSNNGIKLITTNYLGPDIVIACTSRITSLFDLDSDIFVNFVSKNGLIKTFPVSHLDIVTPEFIEYNAKFISANTTTDVDTINDLHSLINREEAYSFSDSVATYASGFDIFTLLKCDHNEIVEHSNIKNNILNLEYRRIQRELYPIYRYLNKNAYLSTRSTSHFSVNIYNYFANLSHGRNRQLAARDYNFFMPEIYHIYELRVAVDQGGVRLDDLISDLFCIPTALVRKLKRIPVRHVGLPKVSSSPRLAEIRLLLKALTTLPLDHIPYTKKEWTAFRSLLHSSDAYQGNISHKKNPKTLIQSFRGRWIEAEHKLFSCAAKLDFNQNNSLSRGSTINDSYMDAQNLVSTIFEALRCFTWVA